MNPQNKLFRFSEVAQIVQRSHNQIQLLIKENDNLKRLVNNLKKQYNELLHDKQILNQSVEDIMKNATDSEKKLVKYIEEMLQIPLNDRPERFLEKNNKKINFLYRIYNKFYKDING
jgi:seryl-tRNA synthetase